MNANRSVIGEYTLIPLGLTVNVFGPGTVTGAGGAVDCSAVNCLSLVDYGTPVVLQAVPSSAPEGEFVSWTGCATMNGSTCSFPLTANRTVTAAFQHTVRSLEIKALSADASVPLARGARRQYSALATFSDLTTQDVTARARWTSSDASVFTVLPTTGLVTGGNPGTADVSAVFSTKTSSATGSTAVTTDSVVPGTIVVACSPFGDPDGPLSCLPAARGFEVECRATASFAQGGSHDVTDQAVWTSTSTAIARPLGLSDFGGPLVASFRIFSGTAAITASLGGVMSSANKSPGTRWVVQSTPLTVTEMSVAPPGSVTVGTPAQLQAMASFASVTGVTAEAAGCPKPPSLPPTRDFSLLTTWSSNNKPVADVNFFGRVDPRDVGDATIHWAYPGTTFQGDVPITVAPAP
jgi:hypothetical protein